jgi:hypothetical protein
VPPSSGHLPPGGRLLGWLAAAALLGLGCGGSVLIRSDDRTFARAQVRLERTRRLVESTPGAGPDAALFLQAESLYRFRFEAPPRSAGNYLAQGLAVATEFAPLQALAASAGMFELRLRSYDGAAQLWETMLARRPDSALAPLALYRLGWAYRSLNTGGFPRETPGDAWQALERQAPGSPLVPLARAAAAVPYKTQDTAVELSLIPGAGQMYAGEWGNGAARLVFALAAAAVAVVPIVVLYDRWQKDQFFQRENWAWAGTSLLGIIVLNVAYTTAYQDAQRAAVEFNERAEARFEDQHPEAP